MRTITLHLIRILTPTAPRCFGARDQWVTYVEAAAVSKLEIGLRLPVIDTPIGPAWNAAFSPCVDCTPQHQAEMLRARRCTPDAFSWSPKLEREAQTPLFQTEMQA